MDAALFYAASPQCPPEEGIWAARTWGQAICRAEQRNELIWFPFGLLVRGALEESQAEQNVACEQRLCSGAPGGRGCRDLLVRDVCEGEESGATRGWPKQQVNDGGSGGDVAFGAWEGNDRESPLAVLSLGSLLDLKKEC